MQEILVILLGRDLPLLLWWVVIPLLGCCLLQTLVNICLLRRLKPNVERESSLQGMENSGNLLDLSVLVPARNEERRIRECLTSLIAQQPPAREIILLDDRSGDRTAEIARELGFREGVGEHLRLIHGENLPEGWVGKNWACHQLSLAADRKNGHLLFTDADTIHGPGCLTTALKYAEIERSDLLSLWPEQITGTWSEKLVIPLLYLLSMAFQPFFFLVWLQAQPERVQKLGLSARFLSQLGVANGQFLLFRRAAYESLGGHEALKDHLVEDVAFGRRIAARTGEGMRVMNVDGGELLRCRMYAELSEVWEGFSKNIRPVFEDSLAAFLCAGGMLGGLFLWPFFALLVAPFFSALMKSALIALLLIFLIRLALTLRFRTSWLSLLAHPLGMTIALLIGLNSWRLCLGGGVSWKGRTYAGATRSSLS